MTITVEIWNAWTAEHQIMSMMLYPVPVKDYDSNRDVISHAVVNGAIYYSTNVMRGAIQAKSKGETRKYRALMQEIRKHNNELLCTLGNPDGYLKRLEQGLLAGRFLLLMLQHARRNPSAIEKLPVWVALSKITAHTPIPIRQKRVPVFPSPTGKYKPINVTDCKAAWKIMHGVAHFWAAYFYLHRVSNWEWNTKRFLTTAEWFREQACSLVLTRKVVATGGMSVSPTLQDPNTTWNVAGYSAAQVKLPALEPEEVSAFRMSKSRKKLHNGRKTA